MYNKFFLYFERWFPTNSHMFCTIIKFNCVFLAGIELHLTFLLVSSIQTEKEK